jgi:nicotinate-nucleotide adenylyltransferase
VKPHRIGIIAGAFNPVTRAHIALADAARTHVDEIVFAMPREFPHKELVGATLEHRIEMLRRAADHRVETTDGGLFIDIARQIRSARVPLATDIYMVCGRDAADRIVTWPYEDPRMLETMFDEFHLLVAQRQGSYEPPEQLRSRIHALTLPSHFDDVSSTEVRRRITANEPWEHHVPTAIVDLVREIYSPPA